VLDSLPICELSYHCQYALKNLLKDAVLGEVHGRVESHEVVNKTVVSQLIYAFHQRLEGVDCIMADIIFRDMF
jgi:hypothetical protein